MATLKELAERCNVSKMTVIRTIDSLGLRGEHVVKKGERGMLDIDDYAASLIADTLLKRAEPQPTPAEVEVKAQEEQAHAQLEATAAIYRSWIEESKKSYEAQIVALKEQLDVKDAQIAQLTALLESQQATLDKERETSREASEALRDALVRANNAAALVGRLKSARLCSAYLASRGFCLHLQRASRQAATTS